MGLELVQLPSDTKSAVLLDNELSRLYLLVTSRSIDLDGSKLFYLKCIYELANPPKQLPITEINFYRIKHYQGNKQVLVIAIAWHFPR